MGGVTVKFALMAGRIRQVALLGSIRPASGRTPKSAISTVSRLTRDGPTFGKQHHRKIAVASTGIAKGCGWRGQKIDLCPLCPRKRTCAVQLEMSALGQKRT